MHRLVIFLTTLLAASTAYAADLICTVPAANVTRAVELCEELRVEMRVRSVDWNTNVCASQFLRLGLLAGERTVTRRTIQAVVATAINDAVVTYESTWPKPTRAVCGDGTLDSETPFNEACDDGNNVNGDGCSDSCVVE